MRIFTAGNGPRLILVPGVQGRWEWFRPALQALAAHCQVTSYSLAGEPGSGWPLEPRLGFENYLRQLDEVTERVGPPAALCGVSYGGFIALRYAATRPDRVSALVLASAPAPDWTPSDAQQGYIQHPWRAAPRFLLTSPLRTAPEIYAAFDTWHERIGFAVAQSARVLRAPMMPATMAARIVEQQSLDFAHDAAAIRRPTLVISGEPHLDRIVPVASTRKYAEIIPRAEYVTLERTGHLGLVTRPDAFAAIVGRFVEHQSA